MERPETREHWGVKWRLKRKRPKFGDYLHIELFTLRSGASWRALHTFFPLSLRSRSFGPAGRLEHNGTPNTQ